MLLNATDGIDLNPVDTEYGWTPLMWAINYGRKEIVKLLLQAATDPMDPNLVDNNDGRTPLIWAASVVGNRDIVEMLLAMDGIDLNRADTDGRTHGDCGNASCNG
jgi:ankyrin repeat protein